MMKLIICFSGKMRTIDDPISWELKGDWVHVETEEGEIIANGRNINWIEVVNK